MNYSDEYRSKLISAEEAVKLVKSDMWIDYGSIMAFPMLIDEELAKNSVLGGLCASGWQVCAIMNRLMVDGYASKAAGMGSFGIRETRWIKPVYADDLLTLRYTVLEKRVSSSKPEMGIVTMRWEAIDQHGTVKTEMTGVNLFKVRNPARTEAAAS